MLREEAINILKEAGDLLQHKSIDNYRVIEHLDEAIGLLERADEIENQ